jgi:hypothetical protein
MNAEFQWWLLLVGLVIGALLVFLVMADFSRSSEEQADVELGQEAAWIAGLLAPADSQVDPALIEEVLRLNRDWLAGPAPIAGAAPLAGAAPVADPAGSVGLDPAGVEGDGPQSQAPEAHV